MPNCRFEVNRLYLTISISVYSKESIMKLTLMFREYCDDFVEIAQKID